MKFWFVCRMGAAMILLSAVAACGRSAPPAPEQAPPSSPPPAEAQAAPPSAPAAPAEPRLVAPVAYERLVELVPEIEGWTRSDPRGEQVPLGEGAIAHAEAAFERGMIRVDLDITDSGFNPLVLMPLAMSLTPGYSERFDGGYRKAESIGAHPGFEEFHGNTRQAEVTVVVGRRFVVSAAGTNVDTIDPVRSIARAVDLSRLSLLK